jgi:hypothetical protein
LLNAQSDKILMGSLKYLKSHTSVKNKICMGMQMLKFDSYFVNDLERKIFPEIGTKKSRIDDT